MEKDNRNKITPDMTVREVNIRYPQAMAVFEKHGIAGCGGKYGPPETLNFFAQAHKVDCRQLIEDLEGAIRGGGSAAGPMTTGPREASDLYRGFVRAAIISSLTAGSAWGILVLAMNAVRGGFTLKTLALAQTHANVQVYGWVGLFIMGFAYHAVPRFKKAPLRLAGTVHLALTLVLLSLMMRFVSQPLLQKGPLFSGLLVSSGILLLIGYSAFLLSMVLTVWKAGTESEPYEKFILASLIWGFLSVVLNLTMTLEMAGRNTALLAPPWDDMLRHIQFHGFISLMIIGVSYRLLPEFLGVVEADSKSARRVFVLFHAGIFLGLWGIESGNPTLIALASGIEILGAILVIDSLNLFRTGSQAVEIVWESPYFVWYIQAAYLWLVVALAMGAGGAIFEFVARLPQPHAYIDAARHALAMGFVATIMLGIAQRVLPLWEGKRLYSGPWMAWVFILVTLGNAVRIVSQVMGEVIGDSGPFLAVAGGSLEFASIALFSANIWKTLGMAEEIDVEIREKMTAAPEPSASGPAPIFGPKTRVFEILQEYPGALGVLKELGIEGLRDGSEGTGVPKFLTLERICKTHNVPVEKAMAALQEFVSR